MKKNTAETFYFGNGKNSAVIRIYEEKCSNSEASLIREDTTITSGNLVKLKPSNLPVNKRKNKRFRVPNSKIGIKTSATPDNVNVLSRKNCMVDLSMSGIQIVTSNLLKPGEEYYINLSVPKIDFSFDIGATVVWSMLIRKVIKTNYFKVGLKFININQEAKGKLQTLKRFCMKG